jgi:4-diphosphocytidyl-2-C-methyl-D-erythritol kinase
VSLALCPEIGQIKISLERLGAFTALMSGSGSSVFGLFPDFYTAQSAATELKKSYAEVFLANSY